MKDNIVIYINETCPYCTQVKEMLNKENIKYTEKLITEYKDDWSSVYSLTGIPTVPTIVMEYDDRENNYFVPGRDFGNAKMLIDTITNYKQSTVSLEKQLIEKLKTLTYNIQVAFGRTDQILRQIEGKLNNEQND